MAICQFLDPLWGNCKQGNIPCEYRREGVFKNCPKRDEQAKQPVERSKPAKDAHGHFIKKEV